LNLEYYKNGILHFFLPICFVAQSIHASQDDEISINKLLEDYQFFKDCFGMNSSSILNAANAMTSVMSWIIYWKAA